MAVGRGGVTRVRVRSCAIPLPLLTAAPAHRCLAVCQVEREERHMREARAVKAERLKSEARGEVWQPPPPPLSGPDALEMSRQVPVLRTTTWSLAGF